MFSAELFGTHTRFVGLQVTACNRDAVAIENLIAHLLAPSATRPRPAGSVLQRCWRVPPCPASSTGSSLRPGALVRVWRTRSMQWGCRQALRHRPRCAQSRRQANAAGSAQARRGYGNRTSPEESRWQQTLLRGGDEANPPTASRPATVVHPAHWPRLLLDARSPPARAPDHSGERRSRLDLNRSFPTSLKENDGSDTVNSHA